MESVVKKRIINDLKLGLTPDAAAGNNRATVAELRLAIEEDADFKQKCYAAVVGRIPEWVDALNEITSNPPRNAKAQMDVLRLLIERAEASARALSPEDKDTGQMLKQIFENRESRGTVQN